MTTVSAWSSSRARAGPSAPVPSIENRKPAPAGNRDAVRTKPQGAAAHKNTANPRQPAFLTGADVGYIKIVDFDKQRKEEKKTKRDMKIRYF